VKKWFLLIVSCFLFMSCPSTPDVIPVEEPEIKEVEIPEFEEINIYSAAYELAIELLDPIVEEHLDPGNRVVIVHTERFERSLSYRYFPFPTELNEEDFKSMLLTKVADEDKEYVESLYSLITDKDTRMEMYVLNTSIDSEDIDEIKFRKLLANNGYLDAESFQPEKYLEEHPYFLDYIEKGFIKSIINQRGRTYEKLSLPSFKTDYLQSLINEKLVFNTNPLDLNSWQSLEDQYSVEVDKLLLYSVVGVIEDDGGYLGIELAVKLIDVDDNGKVLWEDTQVVFSEQFPDEKKIFLTPLTLDFEESLISEKSEKYAEQLEAQELSPGLDVVLLKIDDIPLFGRYPITQEDFIIEQSISRFIGETEAFSVIDKLVERKYKEYFQYDTAVFYTNPYLGGDYSEFENYYGTQYMLAYRIMWKDQWGVNFFDENGTGLEDHIIGIYLKLIDMNTSEIVLTDFIPTSSSEELNESFLYNCFQAANLDDAILTQLSSRTLINNNENVVLINKRMEVLSNYLITDRFNKPSLTKELDILTNSELSQLYHDVYKQFIIPESKSVVKAENEQNYILAVQIVNSWFEEGLTTSLVNAGFSFIEKIESQYSRYTLTETDSESFARNTVILSPIQVDAWSNLIKGIYNIDKIIYYSPLESISDETFHIDPPLAKGVNTYIPKISDTLEWFLFTILDTKTGSFVFDSKLDISNKDVKGAQ